MAPHVLVRVDGDVYAHPLSRSHPLASPQTPWVKGAPGDDIDTAIAYVIDCVALPGPASTIHAAIVDASDAGAARLMAPLWWVSVEETDDDTIRGTARALGLDPDDPRIDHVPMVAAALARAHWEVVVTDGASPDDPAPMVVTDDDDLPLRFTCEDGAVSWMDDHYPQWLIDHHGNGHAWKSLGFTARKVRT